MNPRMYITGQGTPEDFQIIEDFLSEMDIEVVNPYKVGIEMDAPWQTRFLDELKVFEGCEMLFLMDKWDECPACIHIKLEAERTQKDIWRESVMNREKRGMEAVKHAIFDSRCSVRRVFIQGARLQEPLVSDDIHQALPEVRHQLADHWQFRSS